jgi:DNA-binding MarR family transcriptional regulator
MIGRFERFSYSISEISRLWHRIAGEEMKKYDLKGSYSVYFTTLYRFPAGLTASQLVDLCSRDKADVSRAMSLLESKGLVCRIDPDGKTYRAPLALTDQGREIAQHINARAKAAVELASHGLPDEKREIFYEALELNTTNLQKLSRDGIPQK